MELTRDIQDRLKACCLQDPQVAVEVTEAFSQQITVMGAVKTPNTYNLRGRTTLAQAVAMAGGTDDALADTGRVGVIRYQNGQRSGQVFNLKSILAGRANDPEIYGGDQIIVDTSTAKSTWKTLLQAIPLAGVFAMF